MAASALTTVWTDAVIVFEEAQEILGGLFELFDFGPKLRDRSRNRAKPEDLLPHSLAPWIAVLTTLSGSLVAFLASKLYDFLVVSYLATANRLRRLLDHWRTAGSPTDPPRWPQFVDDCENAISIENESWLAKWADR